jgi:hypothetical protein
MASQTRLRGPVVVAIAVAAVAAVVLVVIAVVAAGGDDSSAGTTPSVTVEGGSPMDRVPSRDQHRVGADSRGQGLGRDEAGAVAAAISYAAAPQAWLYLSDEQLRDAGAEVVVPGAEGEALVEELVEEIAPARDELERAQGTVWFVVAPLATKVERYSDEGATVRVWRVAVLSADAVAMPHAGWQTVTFDLEWHGGWRIAGVHEAEGPVPQLEPGQQPWSARYLDEELEGFSRVGVE